MERKLIISAIILMFFLISINFSFTTNAEKLNLMSNTSSKYRAVLIAISDYPGTEHDLNTPVKNLDSMHKCLIKGSNSYYVETLKDDSATLDNVNSKLDWLKNKATDDDISLFYFCGHGTQIDTKNSEREGDTKDECLVLYDEFMPDDDFIDKILEIKGYVIVILDCCKSAGFEEDLDYKYKKDGDLWSQTKVFFISAFKENQNLFEIPILESSLLTFPLVGSLSTSNYDDTITIDEMYMMTQELFEQGKNVFKIGYAGGLNIYPHRGTNRYYDVMDLPIIKGFKNYRPWIEEFNVPEKSGKKCEINVRLRDDNNDFIKIFVRWGDNANGGWIDDKYTNYDVATLRNTYSKNGNYEISVIAQDDKGSISYWQTKEVKIEGKSRLSRFLNQFSTIFQKIKRCDIFDLLKIPNILNNSDSSNVIFKPLVKNNLFT